MRTVPVHHVRPVLLLGGHNEPDQDRLADLRLDRTVRFSVRLRHGFGILDYPTGNRLIHLGSHPPPKFCNYLTANTNNYLLIIHMLQIRIGWNFVFLFKTFIEQIIDIFILKMCNIMRCILKQKHKL